MPVRNSRSTESGANGRRSVARRARARAAVTVAAALCSPVSVRAANVLTYHNDNARSGLNLAETVLTPATVSAATFGKIFSYAVDGAVYAQPLVMTNVAVPGQGSHNVVFVATEHDSVYAFDADDGTGANAAPLWQRSFLAGAPAGEVVTPMPSADVNCDDLVPEIGITSTPVIDPSTLTLYVVAKTKEVSASGTNYFQRLHALDVGSGAEKFGGPVVITATVAGDGTGDGADGSGYVSFNAQWQLNRPALLLSGGAVVVAFGSHCDSTVSNTSGCNCSSHGWLLAFEARTLQPVATLNITPDGALGSIWMAGCGPAADAQGNVFAATSNGQFDLNVGGVDAGDSILKLAMNSNGFPLLDYFTPFDQESLNVDDIDLGSGGVLLLPDQPTGPAHLAVQFGKEGTIYLIDRDNMGHFSPAGNNVVQSFTVLPGCFSTPLFFNSTLFYGSSDETGGELDAFSFANGIFNTQAASQAGLFFPYPGVTPSLSANGASNGILWVIENNQPAVLHAYLPTDLTRELYNSSQAQGGTDQPGDGVKFSVPTVCNGKVYVGTQNGLSVYGLLQPQARPLRRALHAGS